MIWMILILFYHIVINYNNNISVHLVISQGRTPLHLVAHNSDNGACCKFLLDHNADTEAKDEDVSV